MSEWKWVIERAVTCRPNREDPPLPEPLPSTCRLVMLALLSLTVSDAVIREDRQPSLGELAGMVGMSKDAVSSALNYLEGRRPRKDEKGRQRWTDTAGRSMPVVAGMDVWIVRHRPATAKSLGEGETTRYELLHPCAKSPAGTVSSPGAGQGVVWEPDRVADPAVAREPDTPSPIPGQGERSNTPSGSPVPLVRGTDTPSPGNGHIPYPDCKDLLDQDSATSRAPIPADDQNQEAQATLPFGLAAVAATAQTPPASKTAAPRKKSGSRSAKPLSEQGLIAKGIVDEWWARQSPRPASQKFWPILRIVEGHLKAGWTAEQTSRALDDCITAGFAITINTFERALRQPGKVIQMPARNAAGYQPYRDPEDESIYNYSSTPATREASGQ